MMLAPEITAKRAAKIVRLRSLLFSLVCLMATQLDAAQPNIVVLLADVMGSADLGCCGGEIETPNLDALAEGGVRFTQVYNTARCCPTRAYAHSRVTGQRRVTWPALTQRRLASSRRFGESGPTAAAFGNGRICRSIVVSAGGTDDELPRLSCGGPERALRAV